MFDKFKDIIQAWVEANNPSEESKALADQRYEICKPCEHLGVGTIPGIGEREYCKLCSCPFPGKLYTNQGPSGCYANKWIK